MQVQEAKQGYKRVKWFFGKKIEILEEWEILKLSKLCEKENDIVAGPFGSNLVVNDYVANGVPIIRLQNIGRNQFIEKNIKFISKEKAEELKYHSYMPKDLVLAKLGDPIGKTCRIPKDFPAGIVVADVVRIRTSLKKSNSDFIEYVLNSWICEKQFNMEKIGTTRPRVNLEQIRNLVFPCPPIKEQQKIASILSNVDSLINQTQKEIELTQRLKKGLMQRLLTKGIGHTKMVNLGSVVTLQRGHDLPIQFRKEGSFPVIGSNGIAGYHDEYKAKGPGVIIGRSGTLGKVYYSKHDFWPLNTSLYVKEFHSSHPKFVYYLLQTINYEQFNAGTSVPTLNRNFIHPHKVKIPENIEGQQKIASILSNVDSQIQNQQEYKSKLESLKKGLMQKLLTGKIRVKV